VRADAYARAASKASKASKASQARLDETGYVALRASLGQAPRHVFLRTPTATFLPPVAAPSQLMRNHTMDTYVSSLRRLRRLRARRPRPSPRPAARGSSVEAVKAVKAVRG
jgi:hypothetical protein